MDYVVHVSAYWVYTAFALRLHKCTYFCSLPNKRAGETVIPASGAYEAINDLEAMKHRNCHGSFPVAVITILTSYNNHSVSTEL